MTFRLQRETQLSIINNFWFTNFQNHVSSWSGIWADVSEAYFCRDKIKIYGRFCCVVLIVCLLYHQINLYFGCKNVLRQTAFNSPYFKHISSHELGATLFDVLHFLEQPALCLTARGTMKMLDAFCVFRLKVLPKQTAFAAVYVSNVINTAVSTNRLVLDTVWYLKARRSILGSRLSSFTIRFQP